MAVERNGGSGGISPELREFLSDLLGEFYLGTSTSVFADLVRAREVILANEHVQVGDRLHSRKTALTELVERAERSPGVSDSDLFVVRVGSQAADETLMEGGHATGATGLPTHSTSRYKAARDQFLQQVGGPLTDWPRNGTSDDGGRPTVDAPSRTDTSASPTRPGANDLRAGQPLGGGGSEGGAGGDVQALGSGLLRQGSRGDQVRALQQMLAGRGYDVGPVDGIYGPKTAAAVRAFQTDAGISVDGIVGPQTRSALDGATPATGGDGGGTVTGGTTGGGGGGRPSTPTAGGGGSTSPGLTEEHVRETVRRLYGYLAVFLDHPELGPILQRAADQGWSKERIQGAVSKTQWWTSTAQTARQWEVLKSEDPATAEQRLSTRREQIAEAATRFGAPVDDEIVQGIAEASLRLGWTDEQIDEAVLREAQKTGDPFGPGQVQFTAEQLRAEAGNYLVPLSEQAAQEWALKIARNETTPDAFESYLRDQAASMFDGNQSIQRALQSGLTVRQWADPYTQVAAETLELHPREVDYTKPKYRQMIHQITDDGSTPMSLADAQRYLRGLPDWKGTRQATEQSAELTENLARRMGVA